ncbi:MAG TPA: hypothetical protein VIQ00_03460 [Chitinophagaceae bacterium]
MEALEKARPRTGLQPDGAAIKQKILGGRRTYYTEEQRLFS